jgi:hypothetical protein
MSENDSVDEARPTGQREVEEDHDLLTYGEAGARLHEEVSAQRRRVADLEATGAPGLEAARSRLAALQDAVNRMQSERISNDNYERFFGHGGTAKRGLQG